MAGDSAIPNYLEDGLAKQSPESLRHIADVATALANEKEMEAEVELREQEVDEAGLPEEVRENEPDKAPAKASVTTKTIDDNQYYYYQWREGDQIKSEYITPVNPQ